MRVFATGSSQWWSGESFFFFSFPYFGLQQNAQLRSDLDAAAALLASLEAKSATWAPRLHQAELQIEGTLRDLA